MIDFNLLGFIVSVLSLAVDAAALVLGIATYIDQKKKSSQDHDISD